MLNKVFIVGNLGRDPEARSLPDGKAVTEFSVASSRRWKDRDGNVKEETEWHPVVLFGRTAEVAAQYLTQGRQVLVEGRLRTRTWEDQETGKRMSRTEIIGESFKMLGARADKPAAAEDTEPEPGAGDDIPF